MGVPRHALVRTAAAPTKPHCAQLLQGEGLQPYSWANGPLDRYAPHSHEYDKVIYVVSGSITFGLPRNAGQIELKAGDRLDLPGDRARCTGWRRRRACAWRRTR